MKKTFLFMILSIAVIHQERLRATFVRAQCIRRRFTILANQYVSHMD
ncbi:MAG: hypothetical protein LBF39_02490 [Prevotellaceae bacterium]|nr:hypothetical protein [Prevotellaceae bacterium]